MGIGNFLLPWEKVAAEGGRMRENHEIRRDSPSSARHPAGSFSQGRSGAVALAALLLAPASALACSCSRIGAEGFRARAEAIVEGRVTSVEREGGINGRVTARIAVARQVKGETPRVVTVTTRGNSAACGVPFHEGQTGEFLLARQDGAYTTNLCLMMGARR